MPQPFLKWAGGKRALLAEILKRLPSGEIPLYIEPFLGGGAVFFALARAGRVQRAILNDRNPELIHAYRMVKEQPKALIQAIYKWKHSEKVYYDVRRLKFDKDNRSHDIPRAARLLWLNKTCYNGLYRTNKNGDFNVPFGRYQNPRLVDEENLYRCSEALQNVDLHESDFDEVMSLAGPGSVVYCDPPYSPMSKTASFTRYDGARFGVEEQARLTASFKALAARGAFGLLSNSCTEETRHLYADLPKDEVFVRRNINSRGDRRGRVAEFLVKTCERG